MLFYQFVVWVLSVFGCPALVEDDFKVNDNILEVCENTGAFTFVKYARSVPWVNQILGNVSSTGYMALAPSDRAFERLPPAVKTALQDPQVLEWYLRYHIGLTVAYLKEINNNLRIPSAFRPPGLDDQSGPVLTIRFNVYDLEADDVDQSNPGGRYGKLVTASGAPIILADIQASNGLVHIIDKVMFPIPTGDSMTAFLSHDPRFSTLYMYLKKAKLTMALATDPSRPLTLFAPSNTAFKNLPKAVVQKLSNVTFLTEVLKYHVVKGAFYAASLYDNQRLHPLFDREILVLIGKGGIFVENQQVVQADTTVTNGVVHEVSGVLIPPTK